MKLYEINYKNGNTLQIKAHQIKRDDTGYMVCVAPVCGIASFYHLSNEYVKEVKEVL